VNALARFLDKLIQLVIDHEGQLVSRHEISKERLPPEHDIQELATRAKALTGLSQELSDA